MKCTGFERTSFLAILKSRFKEKHFFYESSYYLKIVKLTKYKNYFSYTQISIISLTKFNILTLFQAVPTTKVRQYEPWARERKVRSKFEALISPGSGACSFRSTALD